LKERRQIKVCLDLPSEYELETAITEFEVTREMTLKVISLVML